MIQTPKSFYFAVALVLLTVQAQAASEAFSSGAFGSFSRLLSAPVKTLVTGLPAVRALSDEDNLLDLMGDSEPAVRAQAAKSLRTYVLTSYRVENRLLDAAGDRNEKPEVRREAIKSLPGPPSTITPSLGSWLSPAAHRRPRIFARSPTNRSTPSSALNIACAPRCSPPWAAPRSPWPCAGPRPGRFGLMAPTIARATPSSQPWKPASPRPCAWRPPRASSGR